MNHKQKSTSVRASVKEDERDFFLYKASHDLKAPLASIMGITSAAKEEVTDKTALNYFSLIEKSTSKLDSTISDLMDYTRITKGQVSVSEINFSKIINDIIESLTHKDPLKKVDFQISVKQGEFFSDSNMLICVLQNLVDNAIKYRQTNTDSFVKINVSTDTKKARILVKDNGIGISEEFQEKIFDMFFRASTHSNGSGLGLFIVKNAIKKLKGTISFKSKLNQGTTFVVIIPNMKEQTVIEVDN